MTVQKIRDLACKAMQNPWFAYGTIFLLQLKAVWGMWLFRDLSSGDTSYYFLTAWDWYRNGHLLMSFSPLYTSFYGTMLQLSSDAYAATSAHRLITVLVLSVMVLALMRRLLPPAIAWLMAAWWVVLPIDFDSLFEVHLFAVIPVVATLLLILWKPGPWGRGCGVAALLAATFLMRNELLVATLLFAALAIGWDLRQMNRGLWRAYGIPFGVACLAILFFYARSNDILSREMPKKHTLNVCQTYAFGYQQRHSDWKGFSWLECQQLMTRVYGTPEPAMIEALRRNPGAMLEHFWWNLQLVPNGLQVLLFNCMSGSVTPDYIPAPSRFLTALLASLLTLTIAGFGSAILWREREYWWTFWLSDRIWAWVAMACVSITVMVVMVTQRPRPSYMLAFGIVLRAALGMCLFAVVRRFPHIGKLAPVLPLAALSLILFTPNYYYAADADSRMPLLDLYRRLKPFYRELEKPDPGVVTMGWSPELCNYLGKSRTCRPLDLRELRKEVSPNMPWNQVLNNHNATLFYADNAAISDALSGEFVAHAQSYGWKMVARNDEPGGAWAVLENLSSEPMPSGSAPQSNPEIVAPDSGISLGPGWHAIETFPRGQFRWVNNDAELIMRRAVPGPVSLQLEVEPGPSLDGRPLAIQVFGDGQKLQPVNALGRQTVTVELPSGHLTVRLHVESVNRPVPHDSRILNFRVFKVTIR